MPDQAKMAILRIYTDEKARGDSEPLHTAIIERARAAKLAGATVLRGSAGFGVAGKVQRESVLDLSFNLPIVIEIVDREDRLRAFFTSLHGLEDVGLVTLEAAEVLHYDGNKPIG